MDLNIFKLCSGLKFLGYLMILLVAAIIAVSYYVLVVLTWGPQLCHGGFTSFFSFTIIILFHLLLVLLTWSYIMVVSQDPGSVPENWKPASEENLEAGVTTSLSDYIVPDSSVSTSLDVPESGQALGYCRFCRNGKPPRCHHCSVFVYISGDDNGYYSIAAQFHEILQRSQRSLKLTKRSCSYLFGFCFKLGFCTEPSLFHNNACVSSFEQYHFGRGL